MVREEFGERRGPAARRCRTAQSAGALRDGDMNTRPHGKLKLEKRAAAKGGEKLPPPFKTGGIFTRLPTPRAEEGKNAAWDLDHATASASTAMAVTSIPSLASCARISSSR